MKKTFFAFGSNDTVQQAADRAVANYPMTNDVPIFNHVCVFFKDGGKEVAVTDINANFHSIFQPMTG